MKSLYMQKDKVQGTSMSSQKKTENHDKTELIKKKNKIRIFTIFLFEFILNSI
jgi:hypothetical protein